MKSKRTIAALVATAGLLWGSAHAAPEAAEAMPEAPGIIIFELQPAQPGVAPESGQPPQADQPGTEHQQMILGMLLQMLSGMQAEGESIEILVAEPPGQRI